MTTTSSMLPSYNHHSTHQSPFSSAFKSSVHRTSVLTRSSNAQDPSSNGSLLVKDKPSFPGFSVSHCKTCFFLFSLQIKFSYCIARLEGLP
uniref:Uncharacterized protein LOC103441970 n=1 Tax=Rhizophora mucronata TaxID=61149 RepID=A0A2P2MQY0_RHIMU